jgi:NADPH-dependent glutamate synthase beta subunit-like oxidoreductase/NAD-dependent dihydropyrimidine dehydrogenase PreA subunit/ferredoxin
LSSESLQQPITIALNGRELSVAPGTTVLQAAEQEGVDIPTLCNDPRLEPYASCWLCVVEIEGRRTFVPACSTRVAPGMVIRTHSEAILRARRLALELLLSNHYGDCKAPCTLACPAAIDVQGYVGLIANGKYGEALRLIKQNNPFPAVIGRVCPRPCETACRRNLVDEAVGIDYLKRFVADIDLFGEAPFTPVLKPLQGKRVAIVGAGPAGLSAAYYLIQEGVQPVIYEAEEKAGGMLRYGIPDYRLPQDVLDREIDNILSLGVELKTKVRLGEHVGLEELRSSHDAVILTMGAWKSRPLRVAGEDLPGVIGGIEFLRSVAKGKAMVLGERVTVVGGGNTAIDAARSALRLGCGEVNLYYRRTRTEMPATAAEIDEALEEGVKITYLAAPVRIEGTEEKLSCIWLTRMELGEPDSSGRRRPLPVARSEFAHMVDTVISAIGQYSDTSWLAEYPGLIDERNVLVSDADSGATPLPGVFAAGDLASDTDIAIGAIAGGKRTAGSVLAYLSGESVVPRRELLVKKDHFRELTAEDYADRPRIAREKMNMLPAEERRGAFVEIEHGYSEEQALREAGRCLECGCQDVHECRLKAYSEEYGAGLPARIGEFQRHPIDESHRYISRDAAKCILCGRCVRICNEIQGLGVLGYIQRGFASVIAPSFGKPMGEDGLCISCGQCVSTCPVGALTEKHPDTKPVPLHEAVEESFCGLCSLGCPLEFHSHGSLVTRVTERVLPGWGGKLCRKGRFEQPGINQDGGRSLQLEGEPVDARRARKELAGMLAAAERPVLQISPYLAGETIDTFLEVASRRALAVKPNRLERLSSTWTELLSFLHHEDFFAGLSRQAGIVLLVGDLEEANNVAVTDCLTAARRGQVAIWTAGRPGVAAARVAERNWPQLADLREAVEGAGGEKGRLRIVVNPEELRGGYGPVLEEQTASVLLKAARSGRADVLLLWNSRNAGYLLRKLNELKIPVCRDLSFDLLLDVGGEIREALGQRQFVRWGRKADNARLFIPLPEDYWRYGHMEPSGRPPLDNGRLKINRRALLLDKVLPASKDKKGAVSNSARNRPGSITR